MRRRKITLIITLLLVLVIPLIGCQDTADTPDATDDTDADHAMSFVLYDSSLLGSENRTDDMLLPLYRADWDIDTGDISYNDTSMMTVEGKFGYESISRWDGYNRFLINENLAKAIEFGSDIKLAADERDPTVFYGEGITMQLTDDTADLVFDDGEELSFNIEPGKAPEPLDGPYLANIIGLGATDEFVTIIYKIMQKEDGSVPLFCVRYDREDGSVTWSETIELTEHDTSDVAVYAWFNACYFDGVRLYYSGINIWCYDTSTNEVYELERITKSVENLVPGYTRETLFDDPLVSNVMGGMNGTAICSMTLVDTDTGEWIGVCYAIAEASLIGVLARSGETLTTYDANLQKAEETVIDLPLGALGMKFPVPNYRFEG